MCKQEGSAPRPHRRVRGIPVRRWRGEASRAACQVRQCRGWTHFIPGGAIFWRWLQRRCAARRVNTGPLRTQGHTTTPSAGDESDRHGQRRKRHLEPAPCSGPLFATATKLLFSGCCRRHELKLISWLEENVTLQQRLVGNHYVHNISTLSVDSATSTNTPATRCPPMALSGAYIAPRRSPCSPKHRGTVHVMRGRQALIPMR